MWKRIFCESSFKPDPQVFLFLESPDTNVDIWKIESDLLEMGHDSKYCKKKKKKKSGAQHIFHVFGVAP